MTDWASVFKAVFTALSPSARFSPVPAAPSPAAASEAQATISVAALAQGVHEASGFDWRGFFTAFAAHLSDLDADLVDIETLTKRLEDAGFPWAQDALAVERLLGFALRIRSFPQIKITPGEPNLDFERSSNFKDR